MSRTTENQGKVFFVGAGPGGEELLTRRAAEVLASVPVAIVDEGIDPTVLDFVGTLVPRVASEPTSDAAADAVVPTGPTGADPANLTTGTTSTSGATRATGSTAASDTAGDGSLEEADAESPQVERLQDPHPEAADTGRALVAEARKGHNVVRLVRTDPLTSDRVIAEINTVARTTVDYEIVPGAAVGTAIPSYVGVPLGSEYGVLDVRGEVESDVVKMAGVGVPLVIRARTSDLTQLSAELEQGGMSLSTPAALTTRGSTRRQRTVDSTVGELASAVAALEKNNEHFIDDLVVTVGKQVAKRERYSTWESRDLFGMTVLVPRTKEQSGSMVTRLIRHGAVPWEVPTISVEPPRPASQMDRAVKNLVDGRYQWIVLTSTNAVKAVWEKFRAFGLDSRVLSGVRVACVGEATAEAVRAHGVEPDFLPVGEQSSRGLVEVFPPFDDLLDPVNRVLLPRADIATETLIEGLTERGWEAEAVTAYRTVRAAPPPKETREMIKTGGFDAVCFTSSSTVRNLVGIAGKPHQRTLVACIGPRTAETAREFGLRVDVQPDTPNVLKLVDALAAHAAQLRADDALPPPRRRAARKTR